MYKKNVNDVGVDKENDVDVEKRTRSVGCVSDGVGSVEELARGWRPKTRCWR